MPPVSHPFKKGALVVLMNFNDHAPPHVHVRYEVSGRRRGLSFGNQDKSLDEAGQRVAANIGKAG